MEANTMSEERTKLPHRPEQYVGRWAVSLGHEIFKITEAYTIMHMPHYIGVGMHGQRVETSCPSVLPIKDHNKLEEVLL
jgi:hypothetical protein